MARPCMAAFAVFVAVVSASALYTATRTRGYEGIAKSEGLLPPVGQDPEREFFTYEQCVGFAKSQRILGRVAARITGADFDRVLAPYARREERTPDLLHEVLSANSHVWTESARGPIVIAYRHPDPEIAAKIANVYIEEVYVLAIRIRVAHPIEPIEQTLRKLEPHATAYRELALKLESLSQSYQSAHSTSSPSNAERELIANYESLERRLSEEKRAWSEADRELRAEMNKHPWEFRGARQIDWAKPPTDYIYPSHVRHFGGGLAAGLVAGLLTTLIISRRQTRQANLA